MNNTPRRRLTSALTYGLGRKLVVSFGAVLVAFVCVNFVVNLGTQRHMIESRLDERTNELTKLLTEISSSYLFELRVSDLEIILEDIQRQPDVDYVRLIDPEGFILATGTIGDSTFLTRDDDLRATAGQPGGERTVAEYDNVRHIAAPIELAGEFLGTIRVGISLSQYQSDISLLQNRNASIGITFVAIGLAVSILMSQRLTKPLRRLIDLTRSARDGNLDQSLELSTNDEIETLAAEFGEMLRVVRRTLGEINRLAYTDSLTGLRNRAWFTEFLNTIVKTVDEECSAIIFLDLDKFKDINDTHGHDVGDHVLCEMARRLQQVLKCNPISEKSAVDLSTDLDRLEDCRIGIARLGGDEFTILIRGIPCGEDVKSLARSIVATMRQPFEIGRKTFKTSVSVGIALIPEHGTTAPDILKSADVAMYQAKKAGRDTYCVFDADNAAEITDRRLLAQSLIVGIAEQQLVLHFQPQFDVITEEPIAAEALVRWQHPSVGLIPASDFLPLAEDAGLMGNIGRFVVSEGLELASKWPCRAGTPLRLALNIGVRELSNHEFVDYVLAELDRTGFAPDRLELEVTEGTAMDEDAEIEANIERLRQCGIRFAVDDFGVGYSNLSRLTALQFETLKIDRSLLGGVGDDSSKEAVITSLLQLSQTLRLDVVAEGVERPEQLDFLRQIGCDYAQGFGLSRPLPNAEFLALLSRTNNVFFASDEQNAA